MHLFCLSRYSSMYRNPYAGRSQAIIVANHTLVMIQAALGGMDDGALPTRYVFDEGHHVFDAADSAFWHLTAIETINYGAGLIGAEGSVSGRARPGLKKRVEDLVADDEKALQALPTVMHAARALREELADPDRRASKGVKPERFLTLVRPGLCAH